MSNIMQPLHERAASEEITRPMLRSAIAYLEEHGAACGDATGRPQERNCYRVAMALLDELGDYFDLSGRTLHLDNLSSTVYVQFMPEHNDSGDELWSNNRYQHKLSSEAVAIAICCRHMFDDRTLSGAADDYGRVPVSRSDLITQLQQSLKIDLPALDPKSFIQLQRLRLLDCSAEFLRSKDEDDEFLIRQSIRARVSDAALHAALDAAGLTINPTEEGDQQCA